MGYTMKNCFLKIDEELDAKIKAFCEKKGMTKRSVIIKAISMYLEAYDL